MEKSQIEQERLCAVIRFFCGENSESICASLGRSKPWLYKWINRYTPSDTSWSKSRSRRPYSNSLHTPEEVEETIKMIRRYLKNQGLFCGDNAIHWELKEMDIRPLPSLSTINRILRRHELMHHGTGRHKAILGLAPLVVVQKGDFFQHFQLIYRIKSIKLIL